MQSQTEIKKSNSDQAFISYIIERLEMPPTISPRRGGKNFLASKLGVSRAAVSNYVSRGFIPAKYAFDIEEMTEKRVTAREVCEMAKQKTR